jgi:hypothetical protein
MKKDGIEKRGQKPKFRYKDGRYVETTVIRIPAYLRTEIEKMIKKMHEKKGGFSA